MGSLRGVYLKPDAVVPRRDFDRHGELVLLIHGFFQTRNLWEVMEDRLRHDGYGVMSFNLAGTRWRFNTQPVDNSARLVAEKVERLAERFGFTHLHVVGHSKGGLIARRYVQHYGGDRRVKSVLTLGTPHHGTPTAWLAMPFLGVGTSLKDLLPRSRLVREVGRDTFPAHIPLTSLYSREDLVCPWWASVLRPMPGESHLQNVAFRGLGHSQLAWSPAVYKEVRARLEEASRIHRERQAGRQARGEAS